MSRHILFVCKFYHLSSKERPKDQPADGTRLIEQLSTAFPKKTNEFEIRSVGCLWTCDKPCAAAFSASHKPTYLFTNLPVHETAPALLQFGKLYFDSTTGDIPWKQFPKALQSASIAKIPAVGE